MALSSAGINRPLDEIAGHYPLNEKPFSFRRGYKMYLEGEILKHRIKSCFIGGHFLGYSIIAITLLRQTYSH